MPGFVRTRSWRCWGALLSLLILAGCSGDGARCLGEAPRCEGTSLTFCDSQTATLRTVVCKGPLGCAKNRCDSSTHTVGDGCAGNGSQCDALAGYKMLYCVAGQLQLFRTCSGARQCFRENDKTICDVTLGDTCPAPYEASYFCDSVDVHQVVRCTDGRIAPYSTCPGGKRCASADGGLICQ